MTELPSDTLPLSAANGPAEPPSIPGYEDLVELGRGGMGVVYQARQSATGRQVALKLIRDGALAGPAERARFQIEIEAAARLRHPNVVRIDEAGSHDGRAYLTMELVAGGSLEHRLAGQPQAPRDAAELVLTLARAVHYAHQQQIVHRDLKPANILLASGIGDPALLAAQQPKIADFGLAKRLDTDSTGWTRDGAVLGTASYMAPEQAAGRTGDIGPAVDVYALGAILYEMLTGQPPFRSSLWHETLFAVLNDPPTPPSRLRPGLPAELETICLKCLEKERQRRYASAHELAVDLQRYLAGQPVAALPQRREELWARLAARDGYTLYEEIGRGPRSVVFRAAQGPLEAPVAVKIVPEAFASRDEFEQQIRASTEGLAALHHPQIVLPQQAGWWDGAAYFVTEYCPHGCLASKLREGPLPIREAMQLVERLADIVSYVHRQGGVHGNLKPTNVVLAADGIPRLIDFRSTGGLFQGAPAGGEVPPAGLAYLAPELARDRHAEIDRHTDVYGLGAILYTALTGRPPIEGQTADELLEGVASQEPLLPSHWNAEVTPQLDAVCRRCLGKNPWARYHRAFDLRGRLHYLREGRATGQARGAS